jgi:ABC-type transporter Mla subunit MlaD
MWVQRQGVFSQTGPKVTVILPDASGLQPGQVVVWRGVPIGHIARIGRQGLQPIAEVLLEEGMPPCAECVAVREMRDVFGGMRLSLECPSSPCTPWAGQPLAGSSHPDMAQVVALTGDVVNSLDVRTVNRLVARFDTLTASLAQALPALAATAQTHPPATLVAELRQALQGVNQLLAEARQHKLVGGIAHTRQAADSLLTGLNGVTTDVRPLIAGIQPAIARLDTALLRFTQIGLNADSLFRDIRGLLSEVRTGQGLVNRLAFDSAWATRFDSTLERLNQSLETVNSGNLRIRARMGFGR